jgi:hypothetical protein
MRDDQSKVAPWLGLASVVGLISLVGLASLNFALEGAAATTEGYFMWPALGVALGGGVAAVWIGGRALRGLNRTRAAWGFWLGIATLSLLGLGFAAVVFLASRIAGAG